MFWIRFEKRSENGVVYTVEHQLSPNPTTVDYPPGRAYKERVTQDGAVIVQRPIRDGRPRRWIWRNYPPGVTAYETQWKLLESLEYRTRLNSDLPPLVEVWEDSSGAGGFNRLDGDGNRIFTKVKFVEVYRVPRPVGGPLVYEDSTVEFLIEDPTWTAF